MLRRGSVVGPCERESERSGHCALPWNLSASPGTALRESSGRVDVAERFRLGPSVAFADSRRAYAPERAAGPGDPCPWSRQASEVEHPLHDVVVGPVARRIWCALGASGLTIPSRSRVRRNFSATLESPARPRWSRCANGVLCRDAVTECPARSTEWATSRQFGGRAVNPSSRGVEMTTSRVAAAGPDRWVRFARSGLRRPPHGPCKASDERFIPFATG